MCCKKSRGISGRDDWWCDSLPMKIIIVSAECSMILFQQCYEWWTVNLLILSNHLRQISCENENQGNNYVSGQSCRHFREGPLSQLWYYLKSLFTCFHFSLIWSLCNTIAPRYIQPARFFFLLASCRVAQVVVSWLAANEDQKNLWGPWDLEGMHTFVAKWDMSRIGAFWYCFDSDLTQTLLRHLV